MHKFYTGLIKNHVFANVVLLAVVGVGILAAFSIRRENNPEIFIPVVDVRVAYPGADPEEVEEGVTSKVEAAVDGMEGVRAYYSSSREGLSVVNVEVTGKREMALVKERLRNAVDAIDTFPEGAERPMIVQQTNTESVKDVVVWGALPERQLKALAEEIRSELQALPEISSVKVYNTREYEIAVEVSEEKLQHHDLSLADITRAIQRSSMNLSAGSLRLKGEEVRVRAIGRRYAGPEFEDIVVKASKDGELVTLGDIADIRDEFVETQSFAEFNGQPCVLVEVYKSPGQDALVIAEAIDGYVAQKAPTLPEGANLSTSFDQTEFVRSQISMLTKNGLLGLLLVALVLWLFLEVRLAFWVAMGIPISLAGGLVLLWLVGASLNQITLVGMIVVMGIIVDDAIVVGEAIYVHRRKGKDAVTAAVDGVREVGLPVFASVTTTMMAFLPMMFIDGIMGQFIGQMPLVIIAALSVSLVECLFLLPAHLRHRVKREEEEARGGFNPLTLNRHAGRGLEWFVEHVYGPTIDRAVRHRYVTLCAGISLVLVTVGLVGGGVIKVVMWPGVEGDHLRAYVEFPPGTPPETVSAAVRQVREAAQRVSAQTETVTGEPLIENIYASAPYKVDTAGRVIFEMIPSKDRGVSQEVIVEAWRREIGEIPGALVQSIQGDMIGDSGSSDIAIWLRGRDFNALRRTAESLKVHLRKYEGVYQIADNFRPGKSELQVRLKPSAHALGLSIEDVSQHLFAGYYGQEALEIQRGREDVKVRVRYPREEREQLSAFEDIRIRTPQGHQVPLLSVADIEFKEGVSAITGVNGVRGVLVTAAVDRNRANPGEINTDLIENHIDRIVAGFPGVSWSLSGAEQDNRKMLASLKRNTLIAMLGIFIILATIFRSYIQPVIIMVIIPYGVVGAVFGHMLLDIPLSFLSMGGITALAGVLVNDSIVLIERINVYLAEGKTLHEAVCLGGKRRFRAIFLTSISTCVGLAPLIMESNLQAQIVIPMAVSLASGVACGTMLTLVLIPAFLMIMNDMRRAVYRVTRGTWPTPEEVEPATRRNAGDEFPEQGIPAVV